MDETKDITIENSTNSVVDSDINAEGDVLVGGDKITNIYASFDYQKLCDDIKELEDDLAEVPEDKFERRLKKSGKLEELRKEERDFKADTIRLAETFSKIEINTDRLRQAKEYFEEGNYRAADSILKVEEMACEQKELLAAKEKKETELNNVDELLQSNANEYLIKAQITATDYNSPTHFEDSCKYYEESIRSFPNFDNHFKYACFLAKHNQNNKAFSIYQKTLQEFRSTLAPETMSRTLNNLGALQDKMNEPTNALESYTEALNISRELASVKSQPHLPSLAMTLNNLGILQEKGN